MRRMFNLGLISFGATFALLIAVALSVPVGASNSQGYSPTLLQWGLPFVVALAALLLVVLLLTKIFMATLQDRHEERQSLLLLALQREDRYLNRRDAENYKVGRGLVIDGRYYELEPGRVGAGQYYEVEPGQTRATPYYQLPTPVASPKHQHYKNLRAPSASSASLRFKSTGRAKR